MRAILTSILGGRCYHNGIRVPGPIISDNGCLEKVRSFWPEDAGVVLIASDPEDYVKNDSVLNCFKEALPMSGLTASYVTMSDERNAALPDADVFILTGGHVPTQNAYFHRIGLKEKLLQKDVLILAWSAGSMNCAEDVYAGPEFEGEATDPNYRRWLKGLGITKTNIFPHFETLRDDILDGMRLIEDITLHDSMGHEFLALNNGSYIVIDDGREELFGEAYSIADGKITKICDNGVSVRIS